MNYRLDEIDRRIVCELMRDARNTSAPMIADEVGVSPGTIRNRIGNLEEAGIITGYHAAIDFEQADGRLSNLYLCNAPVANRESLASQVQAIPGVVNVRELMTGRRNLHVLAVGEDTSDLRRIARAISGLGIEIEDEDLVQTETHRAYTPFGPDDRERRGTLSDFISLAGGSEIAAVTVRKSAPIVGRTLAAAGGEGLLDDDALVIAIERDDTVLTPRGNTEIRPDDVVTVFSRGGVREDTLAAFKANDDAAVRERDA